MDQGYVRYFILISSILISTLSSAQAELPPLPCSKKIIETLTKWNVQKPWTRALTSVPGEKVYRASTSTLGKWIELHVKDDQVKADLFTQSEVLTVTFEKKDCVAKADLSSRTMKDRFEGQSEYKGFVILRDKNLSELLDQKKPGVLYLWSPHKHISVEGLIQARKAAEKLGIAVYSVIEPNSTASEVERVAKDLKLPKKEIFYLNSFDLQYRGMRLHFPSLIVYSNGHFTSQVRRGYEDARVYEEYFKSHLEEQGKK